MWQRNTADKSRTWHKVEQIWNGMITWIFESTLKLEQRRFPNINCTQGAEIDLDLPTHPSEGPNMSSIRIYCKSVQRFPRYLPKTPHFFSVVALTLIFKLIRARDPTRLLCEFGTNPFSGSRDISYTKQKSHSMKNRTFRSSLRVIMTSLFN